MGQDRAQRAMVESVLARFAERGGRRTASRQAIVEAVVAAAGHVTAEEIAAAVQVRFPSVNLSTVYRTMEALEEMEVVDHVHLGHGRAVYHLASEAHHHLYCEACHHVEEIPVTELAPLSARLDDRYGFALDRRHFAIVGRCGRCRACRPL